MVDLERQLNECRAMTRLLEEALRGFVDVFIYQQPSRRDQVFISYSHHDVRWARRLKTVLAPMIKANIVNIWDDTMIRSGEDWSRSIKAALVRTKVAVLLVSPEFLDSKFIGTNELPCLLNAEASRDLRVIWCPIEHSLVDHTPINRYQAAIDPVKPLSAMRRAEQGEALVRIAKAIEEAYND